LQAGDWVQVVRAGLLQRLHGDAKLCGAKVVSPLSFLVR
jgi:hypothetical protein